MHKPRKNILDRFIDKFSLEDLKKRVWLITIIGFILCLAIVVGGYFFLNTDYAIEAGYTPVPFWKLLWIE